MPTVRVAVFDLGSSSFHLMVVDASREGVLIPVLRRRSFLHLGTEVARTGGVPVDRAASAVRTVRRLTAACEEAGVDVVVALATAALRDADNGSRLISRLESVLGSPIKQLTGEEEARLCFLGQRAGVWVGHDPVLGLDLGGRQPRGRYRHHRRGQVGDQRGPRDGPAAGRAVHRRAAHSQPTGRPSPRLTRSRAEPIRRDAGRRRPRRGPGSSPAGGRFGPWPAWPWACTDRSACRARSRRSRSIKSSCPPASWPNWPNGWPPSIWTPAWPYPVSRLGGPLSYR